MWWIYPVYILLAAAIVFLSIKLGDYVDALDKKTKISGAFIGGILLAAVTSLPELFTSISSIFLLKETGMVVGNILGSDLFNTTVLGLNIVMFLRTFKKAKFDRIHIYSLIIVILMAGLTLYGIVAPFQLKLGPINCLVFLMLGLYIVNLLLQPKESEKSEEADSINLTVKQILLRFIICAVLLVSVSIAITYATDIVADELNLSATFAGSLFLAIATSLPEVVSTITLCKKGNFNAGFGNIIGSNVFNFLILVIAEFMSFAGSVFKPGDVEAKMMSIYLIIGSVVGILILLNTFIFRKNEKYQKHPMIFNISSIILGLSTISCYLLYLLVK